MKISGRRRFVIAMPHALPPLLLLALGVPLFAGGLGMGSWWVFAGGVVALTGAAWLVTEPQ